MFIFVVFVILVARRNIMSVLLLLELIGFLVIYFVGVRFARSVALDFFVMAVFCVLVMEGVISLCGLITMVRFGGSDYVRTRALVKL